VGSGENLFSCCSRQTSSHSHAADPGRLSREMTDWHSSQGEESSCNLCYTTVSIEPGPGFSALGEYYLSSVAAAGLLTAPKVRRCLSIPSGRHTCWRSATSKLTVTWSKGPRPPQNLCSRQRNRSYSLLSGNRRLPRTLQHLASHGDLSVPNHSVFREVSVIIFSGRMVPSWARGLCPGSGKGPLQDHSCSPLL